MPASSEQWGAVLAVYVDRGKVSPDQPAVLGAYRVEGGVLRFEPRFPLARGLPHRAVFRPAALPGGNRCRHTPQPWFWCSDAGEPVGAFRIPHRHLA